ncbi:MAG TPA: hypothetical protein VM888_15490 [Chitinophagaceae bacterium]|nr:hypothetical protein [Chitinophagaceae bacterium]
MKKHLSFLFLLLISIIFVQAQEDSLTQYKGLYKFKEGSAAPSVEISIQQGALYAASSIGSAALSKLARDTFSIPEHSGMVYFYRNTAGVVNAIRVDVGGMVMDGTKEPNAVAIRRKYLYHLLSK